MKQLPPAVEGYGKVYELPQSANSSIGEQGLAVMGFGVGVEW